MVQDKKGFTFARLVIGLERSFDLHEHQHTFCVYFQTPAHTFRQVLFVLLAVHRAFDNIHNCQRAT